MSDNIYKAFIHNKETDKYHIYVFIGNIQLGKLQIIQDDFNKDSKQEQFIKLFSEYENTFINDDNTNVTFVNVNIYETNTWEEVAIKIASVSGKYSYQELYLYGTRDVDFGYDEIMEFMTHEGYISKKRLLFFMRNCIVDPGLIQFISDHDKTLFDYSDLKEMNLIENIRKMKTPLGLDFKSDHRYQYFNDPNDFEKGVFEYESEFTPSLPLFTYFLNSKAIYVHPYNDEMFDESMHQISVYYPMLKGIIDNDINIKDVRSSLISDMAELKSSTTSKDIINKYFNSVYDGVPNMKSIVMTLLPLNKTYISLETMFKILPTNIEKSILVTKYNPGTKGEKLFKLATNEYKEPILRRTYLQKIQTEMTNARKRYVGIYCEYNFKEKKYPAIIKFYENGKITIYFNSERLIDDRRFEKTNSTFQMNDYSDILKSFYNDIIEHINSYFDHSGTTLPLFYTFKTHNVSVDDVHLRFEHKIDNNKQCFRNLQLIENVMNSFLHVTGNKNNGVQFNITPMFRIKQFMRIYVDISLLDSRKQMFTIDIRNIGHYGMIEYLRFYLFSLLNICKSPKSFTSEINDGVLRHIQPLDTDEEEKEKEDDYKDELSDSESIDGEDLFDKHDSNQSTESVKGFTFENENDDDDFLIGSNDDSVNSEESFLGGSKERNLLQKRMGERDPELFKNNKSLEFLAYSRYCPSNLSRQPIVATEAEMANIDKDTFKGDPLKYGSDKEHMNYYFCPRYWCNEKNISLKPEDVTKVNGVNQSDKCKRDGGTFAEITEFNHEKHHVDSKGEYIYNVPAVSSKSCLPCCFKNQNKTSDINPKCVDNKKSEKDVKTSAEETERKATMDADGDEGEGEGEEQLDIEGGPTQKDEKNIKQKYNYIQQHNKFPLEKQKLGYLPLNIQAMLDAEGIRCEDAFCVLRFGVEKHKNSFLSVLGSMLFLERNNEKMSLGNISQYNVTRVRSMLADALSLDQFVTLQNGNLIQVFGKNIEKLTIKSDIKDTMTYKNLYGKNKKLFHLILDAYNNFKIYIKSSHIIDYFYLFDLISMPNSKLFKQGVNMVILETDDMDVTNGFKFICPTNFYNSTHFERKRDTIMFVKYGNVYEPIYGHATEGDVINIIHSFKFYNKYLYTLFLKFESLQNDRKKYCGVRSFSESKYTYTENTLGYIIDILQKYRFKILKQIIYYDGRVCGVETEHLHIKCYIPCRLSAIYDDIDQVYISDYDFADYEKTSNGLKYVYNVTTQQIPCVPSEQIVKKNMVFGIKTLDGLLAPLKIPEPVTDTNLPFGVNNYFVPDSKDKTKMLNIDEIIVSNEVNKEQNSEIKHLTKKTRTYEKFKKYIRKYLHSSKHKDIRYEITKHLHDYHKNEGEKIKLVSKIIGRLTKISNIDDNDLYTTRLSYEIVLNYRTRHFIMIDDQYLFMNNQYGKNKEILVTQTMLGNKDIYNDDDLYKYVTDKDTTHDYANPMVDTIYDLNTYLEDVKEIQRTSPMTSRIERMKTSEDVSEIQVNKKVKRCPKGTKWDKTLQKCIVNNVALADKGV